MAKKTTDTKDSADFIQEADKANNLNIVNGIDAIRLLSYVERIERLEADKADIQNDINEVLKEAGAAQFDTKAIKEIIKIRKKDAQQRQAEEYIVDQYREALGIV